MGVRSLDHVGVVVDDLEAAIAFFVDLGLEREGAGTVEGEWVDKIVGLDGVRAEVVFVRTPDGNGKLELIKYHSPSDDDGAHPSAANRRGIRHVSFVVDDLDTVLDGLRSKLARRAGLRGARCAHSIGGGHRPGEVAVAQPVAVAFEGDLRCSKSLG